MKARLNMRGSRRWGRVLAQAAAASVVALVVVATLAACSGTRSGAGPAPVTTPSAPAESVAPPAAESAPPPAEAPSPRELEAAAWKQAKAENTVVAYQGYISSYPDGRFADKARARVRELRRSDRPFLAAERKGTLRAYETFLTQFPGHRREAEARAALKKIRADTNGRDITALLAEEKIAVQVRGSDITSVTVRLRRLVKHPVSVRIPAGTLFSAGSSSVQDMLSLEATSVALESKRWMSLDLAAACADISAAIPGQRDSFTVAEVSDELRRLARRLRSEDDTAVRQAAVWIVSDNANYFALGTLIFATGQRVINEPEAAAAMKLVDESGIDITRKAIWYDRDGILTGLPKSPLKRWLLQR
jgi:hypothetical protein